MSNSPKTMWSGPLKIGLISIPCTAGKAWSDPPGGQGIGVVEVCKHPEGFESIDRTHRCAKCSGSPKNKTQCAIVPEGDNQKLVELSADALQQIEEESGAKALVVKDCQPLNRLPVMFATGCYYLRFDERGKDTPEAFATLVAALMKNNYGMVAKWGTRLVIVSAESGVLIMRLLPYLSEIRVVSKKERQHFKAQVNPRAVEKMGTLLSEIQSERFDYAAYRNEVQHLKAEAVARIIKGEQPRPKKHSRTPSDHIDVFAQLENALAEQMKEKQNA